jgi:UDP:flavonoid glycosyltransferase YjiC (YdhE family)
LALAARGRNRLLVCGSGESLPPVELAEWPRLHANIAPAQSNDRLLSNANAAARSVAAAPVTTPTDILRGDATIVYGLPQIDPYAALRPQPVAGPLLPLPPPCVPAGKPALVATLDVHHPAIETLVLALTDFGKTPVHIHIRGMTAPMHNFLAQVPGIVLHADVAAALEMASQASFLLHHASPRMAAIGIGLGVPQCLLPFNIEQNAVADMLQRFNAGYRLEAGTDPVPVADALSRMFRNLDQVQNAQHLSRQLALQPPAAAIERLIMRAGELAAG